MKADISADMHVPPKRYSGVRAQQGRVLSDADFNAAFDVVDEQMTELLRTLVCAAGSSDDGFRIFGPTGVSIDVPGEGITPTLNFEIGAGTFVLGGRVLALADVQDFLHQSDWLSHWLDPAELPPGPAGGRSDIVFLESMVQPVRAVEDREFQERALSTDTTSRLRPQNRVRVLADVPPDCTDAATALRATLAGAGGSFGPDGSELRSNARLSVGFADNGDVADPCAPRTVTGYLGAENQTLRVMLTEPGRFVWNYDHGGDYYRVQVTGAVGAEEIRFVTEPRDPVLFPRNGQVIELLPWDVLLPNREKAAAPLGHLAVLTGEYDPSTRRIPYDATMPPEWQDWLNNLPATFEGVDDDPPRYFYARIWQEPEGGGTSQPTGAAVGLPGTGLELAFGGTGFAGDYWTASFRTDEPSLVLPMALAETGGAPPIGPKRFFAPLALLQWATDEAGNTSVDVDDCRHRFRSLCQVQSCCTFIVGDGHASFGDFDSIQAAVDALPAEGGEICLLPGRHEGLVDLSNRNDVVVHGCGRRTIVVAPPGATDAVFELTGANRVVLRDFAIEADTRQAVVGSTSRNVTLERLLVTVTGTAVVLDGGTNVRIYDCTIRSHTFGAALQAADLPFLGPLVFVGGDELRFVGNEVVAQGAENRNLVAPGGLQVGGDSDDVVIRDNLIRGGNGNGISLGSVRQEVQDGDFGLLILLFGWITIDDDGCITITPPGTFDPSDPDGRPPRILSDGDVTRLEIRHNRIEDHGASGISVAHWFVALEDTPVDDLDEIELEDVVIADNTIRRCLQLDLAASLPIEAAFASGFGGITLSSAVDLQVENNDIRDCGNVGRSSTVGVYVRFGARLRITRNRIYDNGRPATLQDPLLVGTVGGIVCSHVEGREEGRTSGLRPTPAVFIKDNSVISQEGRALEVLGNGQMLVEGNSFASHGNNSFFVLLLLFVLAAAGNGQTGPGVQAQLRSLLAQLLGSAVGIVNTGLNPNLAGLSKAATTDDRRGTTGISSFAVAVPTAVPEGTVMFNDNVVTFDALSSAATLSLCSIAIFSLDCVAMHDNQCIVDSGFDAIFVNTLTFAPTVRVQGNRFRERLVVRDQDGGFQQLSAMTIGLLNATENNQGTNCFLRLGWKKPRIVASGGDEVDLFLDTNRHIVPESSCARYDEITRDFGD